MRGTQEKIGLLAAVTSEYRGTQHSSENGSAAPFKSRRFFCAVQCVMLTRIVYLQGTIEHGCKPLAALSVLSSSWLGYRPFTARTRVRVPSGSFPCCVMVAQEILILLVLVRIQARERHLSTAAVQRFCKPQVIGSNPIGGFIKGLFKHKRG